MIHQPLDDPHERRIHLLLIAEVPGSFLGHGRIGGDGHAMMQIALAEVHLIATVRLERLILQLLEVEKLSFVQDNIVERQRVAGTASVLADQVDDGAIVECNGIFPVGRLEDRLLPAEGLPWLFPYGIMAVTSQTPILPVYHP